MAIDSDPTTKQAEPPLVQLELEPLHIRGELVVDQWWEEQVEAPRSFVGRHFVFLVTFVLPVLLASTYYFLLASNQFVSESHFIVRTLAGETGGNLAALIADQKMSRASDETFAIVEYIKSRDALDALDEKINLGEIFGKSGADVLYAYPMFGQKPNHERLLSRYLRAVDVKVNAESGIAELWTLAFTPEDAKKMNETLLAQAEALVNRLNTRAHTDSLSLATAVVAEYRRKVADTETKLTKFRDLARIVDPTKESAASMSELATLTGKLAEAQVELSQIIELTAESPQIQPIKQRIAALQKEIDSERSRLAGGSSSISDQFAKFDELTLEQSLAAKGLEAAMQHLVTAQQDANRQSYYLQRVVEPSVPDLPGYPHRLLMTLFVAGVSFAVYRMTSAFSRSLMEHKA